MLRLFILMLMTSMSLLGWGCASTVGPHGTPGSDARSEPVAEAPADFPPYQGPKRKVQVVQINIPADDVERYPELREKRVGFGMSSILVETLFDTGRFTFLEEKGDILKRLVEQWELTQDGILVKDAEAPETALQAPDFLLYAEVFDFVACSPIEHIRVAYKQTGCVTSVGVQVRLANTATGEFIPGSTNPLSSQGKYVHTVQAPLFAATGTPFDQSAIGKATLKAVRYAMRQALLRFDRAEW